ncbi:MAG TPA: hypothetical protein VK780_08805, partial [Thermoanaerobaculia bacterium]|nr:hypothetical protein [Thermoanaerobaculia bacterium]
MSDEAEDPTAAASDSSGEAALIQNRLHNLEEIRRVADAYPFRFDIRETVSGIVEKYESRDAQELEAEKPTTSTAGRILALRLQGKAGFLDLSDGQSRLQVYVRQEAAGESGWA